MRPSSKSIGIIQRIQVALNGSAMRLNDLFLHEVPSKTNCIGSPELIMHSLHVGPQMSSATLPWSSMAVDLRYYEMYIAKCTKNWMHMKHLSRNRQPCFGKKSCWSWAGCTNASRVRWYCGGLPWVAPIGLAVNQGSKPIHEGTSLGRIHHIDNTCVIQYPEWSQQRWT